MTHYKAEYPEVFSRGDTVEFQSGGKTHRGEVRSNRVEFRSLPNGQLFEDVGLTGGDLRREFCEHVYGSKATNHDWPQVSGTDESKLKAVTKLVKLMLNKDAFTAAATEFKTNKAAFLAKAREEKMAKMKGWPQQAVDAVTFFTENPRAFGENRPSVIGLISSLTGVPIKEVVE